MDVIGPNNVRYDMNSRSDLVRFIYALQDELKQHPERWENLDLHTYLGALAGFLSDAHGYYRNAKLGQGTELSERCPRRSSRCVCAHGSGVARRW